MLETEYHDSYSFELINENISLIKATTYKISAKISEYFTEKSVSVFK